LDISTGFGTRYDTKVTIDVLLAGGNPRRRCTTQKFAIRLNRV
jgi:hypothetical protein